MVQVPSEPDSETRAQEQVFHLGTDPREVYLGLGKRGSKGEEANKGCVIKAVPTLGNWNLLSQGDSLKHTPELSQLRGEEGKLFSNCIPLHDLLRAPGMLILEDFWLVPYMA